MSIASTTVPKLQATPSNSTSAQVSRNASRANSGKSNTTTQAALSHLDHDSGRSLANTPVLEKLPTNVFVDQIFANEDDETNILETDRRLPSQKSKARLTANTDDHDDLETVLDIHAVDSRRFGYDDSGQVAYRNACRKFNTMPCSAFYRKLQDSTHIDLSNYSLGAKGSMAICIPLVINSTVTSINLACNDLGKEGITYVGKMMCENEFITELNLSGNKLRTHGAEIISKMLYRNHKIKTLDISDNNFSSTDAMHLTHAIEESPSLRSVNLSHNDFGEAAQHFNRMISENGILQELDISWCQFRGKGAVEVAKGVKENVGMKKLNLSWNGFAEEGGIAMAVALKSCTLVTLDLTNNRLGPEAYGCLIKSFKDNEHLKTLILAKNPIPEIAAVAGLAFLMEKVDVLKLETLSFDDVIYGDLFKAKAEELKQKFSNLDVTWGYSDMYGKRRMKEYNLVEDAMRAIGQYCQDHGIKIVDLFARFDQDDSMSVSHEEFAQGLREAKVPVSSEQIQELINTLDQDGDGEIDFSEMVIGAKACGY